MAEAEVLTRLLQERAVRPDALLSAPVNDGSCAALAALSDSLDFVAASICHFGERRHQDSGLQVGHSFLPLPAGPKLATQTLKRQCDSHHPAFRSVVTGRPLR